ncbi:hypothetical protein BZARG_03595 [Bizionia argentinensis JUB59]|uniref:Uncharacterized protein n=1 Tax=Bizionia argentinensis JUB59 TaxID=1046627 RepID=A0A4U8UG98_9FLAO|nr:hypothetical protein BZARG_03595 [Bizionia argentinensis JUB59]
MYNQWLVLAYLENPADFPMVSTCLQLSVLNHATAHTPNVSSNLKTTNEVLYNILIINYDFDLWSSNGHRLSSVCEYLINRFDFFNIFFRKIFYCKQKL